MISEENKEKGREAERRFQEWLDNHKIPYLYINQEPETFSSFFKEDLKSKRPDFILLIPYFGFIFVDVKYKQISDNQKDFPIDAFDAKKYSSLQRRFNINTWFALSNEKVGYNTWYWIPVSKVLEAGISLQKSSKSGQLFFPIPKNYFIQVAGDDSLSRLFSKLFENYNN
ncbi:MAG: hypothetical protein AABW91_04575 [Nanoarchaeota archaeon]